MKNNTWFYRSAFILFISFFCAGVIYAQNTATTTPAQGAVSGYCAVSMVDTPNSNEYQIDWTSGFFGITGTTTVQYNWTGTDGLNAITPQAYKKYSTPGLKVGRVSVSGQDQTPALECTANVLKQTTPNIQDIGGTCQPQIFGMEVTWNALASGVDQNASTFSWNGTDGLVGTTTVVRKTYNSFGVKTGNVTITQGNQSIVLSCQALVAPTSTTGCFIATAAYGTYQEPEVQVLRNFRDETLLKSKLGREFVDGYYEVSPPIADFIRDHDSLRAVVRAGLDPIIYGLKKAGYTEEKQNSE